jgi:competence protein ComEA
MEKKNNTLASKIWFLFICTVVISTLVLGVKTVSFAQKKATEVLGAVIDINTADQKTLESLPGVGKATAKAIIAGRPYKSIDDLKRVKGMSDAKIQALKDKVTVGGAAASTIPAAASQKASSTQKSATEKVSKAASKLAPGQRININTATKQEIEALPGIGPVKAQAIIEGRPYDKPEDIMKVKGIKQKIFEKIKDNITVR